MVPARWCPAGCDSLATIDFYFRALFLQASLPVQYHRVGLRSAVLGRPLGHRHEKSTTVRCGIPQRARINPGYKSERLRLPGLELRIGGNFDSHHLSVLSMVIEFLAVTAPARFKPGSIGDLPLATHLDSCPGRIHCK